MSLPALLLVRVPFSMADTISRAASDRFRVVLIDNLRFKNAGSLEAAYFETNPFKIAELVCETIEHRGITHAVVLTPLSKIGEEAWKVLRDHNIPSIWSEVFPGGKLLFDRLGCQYTRRNEIAAYEKVAAELEPELPIGTRFPQPTGKSAPELHALHGQEAVVVFGQVPNDHSMLDQDGPSYNAWLDLVFRSNPGTRFLFKQHPATRSNPMAVTPGMADYQNVKVIDESIHSLFQAYNAFAAYGSTSVLEGVALGLPFATCGRHFVNGLTLDASRDASNLLANLRAFKPNPVLLRRRLSFLTRWYSIRPNDTRLLDRITLSSDDYYRKSASCQT